MFRPAALSLLLLGLVACDETSAPGEGPFEEAAPEAVRSEGLLPLRLHAVSGRAWLELPAPAAEGGELVRLLWVESLVTGLGSNAVGLDRGQLGEARLIVLRRLGAKVLLEQPNLRFRAMTENEQEARAVEEAFASSVIWAAPIAAEREDGTLLVELTDFLLRDAHGIASTLSTTGQGSFTLDAERSVLDPAACLALPDNLVFESLLTFGGTEPGEQVRSVAPDPQALTFRLRHQFVRLPAEGYEPRPWHPGAGGFSISYNDHAAALDEELTRRLSIRHRLEVDAGGGVVEPIVYHVDSGIPEPVRSAVLDGVGWWVEAFDSAGLPGAFRVELLPDGVHPLDVRYSVVQWVHRSTRGWSYGTGVVDPRTGERINGHVNLGSLRVRQDRLLIEGLVGTAKTGSGDADDPIEVALSRIRQLAAHEVGHALGLAHNFAASSFGDRASVMDYPPPRVSLDRQGRLDLSEAYGVGIGSWDAHALRLAYGPLPGGAAELAERVRDGRRQGLRYLSDADARPAGAAHPLASLWDDGADPVKQLSLVMGVRAAALARFGEDSLRPGLPLALLHERLMPVYFFHRYQVAATAKSVAGLEYEHRLSGEEGAGVRPVAQQRQRAALAALIETLRPEALDLPEALLRRMVPRPPGMGSNRELFDGHGAPGFDALGAAATSADLTLEALFQRDRCARLVDQHRRRPSVPGFEELVSTVEDALFARGPKLRPRLQEIRHVVRARFLAALSSLAFDPKAAPSVHVRARQALRDLDERLVSRFPRSPAEEAHLAELREAITSAFARRRQAADGQAAALPPPPGSPIGARQACSLSP